MLIRCAIQFDTLRLDSSVVEHLARIQGAWVQSPVWPLFSSCCFNKHDSEWIMGKLERALTKEVYVHNAVEARGWAVSKVSPSLTYRLHSTDCHIGIFVPWIGLR